MAPLTDADIERRRDTGQARSALDGLLQMHGGEIMRFLVSRTGDAQLSSEAFAMFSEDVCRGLPAFEFRSSTRTWVYTIAQRALARARRSRARDGARNVPWLSSEQNPLEARHDRSRTPIYLRSEIKDRLIDLQQQLSDEDRVLLDLRARQRMSWKDIARLQLSQDPEVQAVLTKHAARLRKRYQLLKDRLRELARLEGLLVTSAERD